MLWPQSRQDHNKSSGNHYFLLANILPLPLPRPLHKPLRPVETGVNVSVFCEFGAGEESPSSPRFIYSAYSKKHTSPFPQVPFAPAFSVFKAALKYPHTPSENYLLCLCTLVSDQTMAGKGAFVASTRKSLLLQTALKTGHLDSGTETFQMFLYELIGVIWLFRSENWSLLPRNK